MAQWAFGWKLVMVLEWIIGQSRAASRFDDEQMQMGFIGLNRERIRYVCTLRVCARVLGALRGWSSLDRYVCRCSWQ